MLGCSPVSSKAGHPPRLPQSRTLRWASRRSRASSRLHWSRTTKRGPPPFARSASLRACPWPTRASYRNSSTPSPPLYPAYTPSSPPPVLLCSNPLLSSMHFPPVHLALLPPLKPFSPPSGPYSPRGPSPVQHGNSRLPYGARRFARPLRRIMPSSRRSPRRSCAIPPSRPSTRSSSTRSVSLFSCLA